MITITKSFKWSPNGYDVETVAAGEHEELPERAQLIAKELGVLGDSEADSKAKAEQKAKKEAEKKDQQNNRESASQNTSQ
ncbi:hypothetical protein [Endozoicomonas sp. 2B-B]